MTEPKPLTLYMGESYLVTVAETAQPKARIVPTAFSQNDPRWKQKYYDAGFTFVGTGCLVVSTAMMVSLAYPDMPTCNPVYVSAKLSEVGALRDGLLGHPARVPLAFPEMEYGGTLHWRKLAADMALIAREVAEFGGCIVELAWDPHGPTPPGTEGNPNQHFAVVIEVTPAGDAVIIDPWDGVTKSLQDSRYAKPRKWTAAQAIHGARLIRPKAD